MLQWSKELNITQTAQIGYPVTYPIAFTQEVYAVFLTVYGNRADGIYATGTYTTTTFNLATRSDCRNFVWLAIGQ